MPWRDGVVLGRMKLRWLAAYVLGGLMRLNVRAASRRRTRGMDASCANFA